MPYIHSVGLVRPRIGRIHLIHLPVSQMAAPSLSADDFPALPASPGADKKVGYTGPFKAYTPSEIAAIVAKVGAEGVVPIPDCIPDDSLCKAPQANVVFDSFAAVVKTQ